MPVVLVEVGGVARSGHQYDDRTGVSYEYPVGRYETWIQTGDRFLYQVPRIGYTGCGVVGEVRPSTDRGRLVCDVESVRLFDQAVALKDPGGSYYEADTTYWRDKVYWGQGVRPLSNQRFDAVLAAAGVALGPNPDLTGPAHAGPRTARAVREYALAVAVDAMRDRFGIEPTVMPRNNPGFDLLIGPPKAPVRYVEVTGTQTAEPVFFIGEGERAFSIRNAAAYTIVVVSGINLQSKSHAGLTVGDGAVDGHHVQLIPTQWRGTLLPRKVDSEFGMR